MKALMTSKTNQSGFTLLEILMAITIAAVLMAVAIPSYNYFITQKRVRLGTEDLYNFIKNAQSVSYTKPNNIYLSFTPGSNWCYGLSDSGVCDCNSAGSCMVNGTETIVRSSDYPGQALTLSVIGFSGGGTPFIELDGRHGTLLAGGAASFSLSNLSATISANTFGLVTKCSDNLSSFPSCTP